MDFKNNPALAWMSGDREACCSDAYREIVLPTEVTRNIGDLVNILASGSTRHLREELESAWRFLGSVYSGHLGKKDESQSFGACVVRAAEMEVWCGHLEDEINKFEKFPHGGDGVDPVKYRDSAHWLMHDLVHLHYLRREIMFYVTFLPMANAKQRQESNIAGMSLGDRMKVEKRNEQFKKWADDLVEKRPELKNNKQGIAEELKVIHGIALKTGTIRKII